MSHSQDPKNETLAPEQREQLTAEAELLEETFESAESLEDFTKSLMESLTSKLHANIDEIFKKNT
jgi:pyridoxine 5'-phosphate synthase PdxJ